MNYEDPDQCQAITRKGKRCNNTASHRTGDIGPGIRFYLCGNHKHMLAEHVRRGLGVADIVTRWRA